MQIDAKYLHNILRDLLEESPLACRALLGLCQVEFTDQVPTLAVTLRKPARLRVNLDFIRRHCQTEVHVKTLLMHEFLHILLCHTERFRKMTPLLNIALDAVINAIIHRKLGPKYSEFFSLFYGDASGVAQLLRPPTSPIRRFPISEQAPNPEQIRQSELCHVWMALYAGSLVADDVYDLVHKLANTQQAVPKDLVLIGDHECAGHHECADADVDPDDLDEEVARRLRETLRAIDGRGIWRNPERRCGVFTRLARADSTELQEWRRRAWRALREAILPSVKAAPEWTPRDYALPVLNERDRRSFLRVLWNPLLPEVSWAGQRRKPSGAVHLYLDVSGSMHPTMEQVLRLLVSFLPWIKQPFWAFSTTVEPARIVNYRLETQSTGGTSINAVFQHVIRTRPARAVIITDGIVEECEPSLLSRIAPGTLRAIITVQDNSKRLQQAGIPCVELGIAPVQRH
jgi:hypothetical protein